MTTASVTLDDRTTLAIRQAIAEASAGRLDSACRIGEQALTEGGDPIALNAMLGMLRCRSGEFTAALPHLQSAHAARPGDVSITTNLLTALVETGQHEEALALATPERAKADPTQTIARYRGYVAQLLGDANAAAETYEAVVAAVPNDWQSWNNLGNARLLTGDFDGATEAFQRSLALNDANPASWLNLARTFVKARRFDEAEDQFRRTAMRFPADVQPLKELYDLMQRRDRSDDKLHEVLEQALARAPQDKDLLLAVGRHRMLAKQLEAAERSCRSVLATNPHDADAWLDLASFHEHTAPEKLAELLAEIEQAGVPSPVPDVVRALLHRRNKDYSAGLKALEPVPADFKPWLVEELRAQFLDKTGQADEAFAAFTRMNEAAAQEPGDQLARADSYRTLQRSRLVAMTPEWRASWKAGSAAEERAAPVFLVGFPRSGTTLLDTMLMGHPDVAMMEELPVLDVVSRGLGGFDAIADLDEDAVRKARAAYFDGVARDGADGNRKVLVDKNPFHLMQVPLIHRLFPDAHFILALRHPADVVLSCYFTNFRYTPPLANFLRLDTAADFYDVAFSTWERSRGLMPISVSTVKYEELVADPESQLRLVAEALQLDWHADMADHHKTAASRGTVATASYAQVTEPIYRSSVDRWKAYRTQLEPVLPTLQPWAEKFGYEM